MTSDKLAQLCGNCGAECCRYVTQEIDEPKSHEEIDNVRWFLLHYNVNVYCDTDGDWSVEFKSDCKNLGKHNQCTDYEHRPTMCREHGCDGNCEGTVNHPDELYKHFFSNVEEFDEFLEERYRKKKEKQKRKQEKQKRKEKRKKKEKRNKKEKRKKKSKK